MMKTRFLKVSLAVACLVLSQVFLVFADIPKYDEEHIVDVSKLKQQMAESTAMLKEKLVGSQLNVKFKKVFTVLEKEKVDNVALKASLENLEKGVADFRADWNNMTEPLWKGQDAVGETISKVRTLLASSQAVSVMAKDNPELAVYENRLKKLAREISDEPDSRRKEKLKLLFKNIHNLKQIKGTKTNLSPTSQLLLSRIVQALGQLELQFTRIIFTAEEAYAVLGNQQQFLQDYIQVVKGLIDIEELAGWLSEEGSGGLASVEGLLGQFQSLNKEVGEFEEAMNAYSEKLVDNIEEHSENLELKMDEISTSGNVDAELEKLIGEYAGKEE